MQILISSFKSACLNTSGINFNGNKSGKTFFNCLFFALSKSLKSLASSFSLSRAGFRSITSLSFLFLSINSTTVYELADIKVGPLTPKCVNSISPKSVYILLPSSYMLTATFLSESPCNCLIFSCSSKVNGTKLGYNLVTLCPVAFANL